MSSTTVGSNSDGSKVQVIVRCRPLLSKEIIQEKTQKCIKFSQNKQQIIIGNNKEFTFDEIFDDKTNQMVIFDRVIKPLVLGCLLGYNATVFAYGQTGSGKTHTMGTSMELLSTEDEGIIPRAVRYLFNEIESNHHGKVMNLRLSFLEIYNEEMRDLLHPEVPSRDISIREDHLGRIFFTGARDEIVTSVHDVFKFLERGTMNRSTGETLMNDASSRSHAIFTMSLEIYESQIIERKESSTNESDEVRDRGDLEKPKKKTTEISSYIHSKLHLVDLAGSERAKRTGAVGVRLKESVGINQGLLSLGKVIRALTTTTNQQNLQKSGLVQTPSHVPYRESKLTRFLQDSLGGNSRTLMVACISPSELDIHETLTTLQYASRARAVQNKIKANISTAHIEMDTNLIDTLREQLLAVQSQLKEQQQLTNAMREREDELLKMKFTEENQSNSSSYQNIAEVISEQKRVIILERLSGIQRVLQNAVKYFDHGVDHGVIQIESTSQNSWEDAVCNVHNSASILEDISKLVKESSGESVASAVESLGGQTATPSLLIKKIQALQIELAECREDLKRDEEIFGEKVMELKQTRRALKKSQEEVLQLHELLAQTKNQNQNQEESSSPLKSNDNDSLEMSRVVAATEPHVSQLMEDLEMISKEKEKLGIEKEIAERKCNVAISLAEKQREEFDQSRHQLTRQLKELEIGIKMKQEVISSLTREQQEISGKAELYAAQILKLETESQILKSKLKAISQETIQNDETMRETQRSYEAKIKTAQHEISLMRKQWRREQDRLKANDYVEMERETQGDPPESPQIGNPSDLLEELESMKNEHKRLRSLLEEDDVKQKQQLKILSQQMESYKKKAHESQKQIKLLEAKNIELQQTLGGHSQSSSLPAPPPRSAGGNGGNKEGSYLKRHSNGTTPTDKTSRTGSFNESENKSQQTNQFHFHNPTNYFKQLMKRLITARTSSEEEIKIHNSLTNLQQEKEKLENEKEFIQKKSENGEMTLRSQLKEMEGRVSKITKEMNLKKKEYKKFLEMNSDAEGSEQELQMKTDISESERTLRSLREYRAELTVRLDRGFLSSDEQQRLQELKDELEANDAEIQLNQLNLLSLSKNPREKNSIPSSSSSSVPPSTTTLVQDISNEILTILTSNPENPSWNNEFMTNILQEMVDQQIKNETIASENSSIQLKYDDKNTELEQIMLVLHRTRNELNKKLEKQQKEYENKISFLIQQLRNSEVKLHENSLLLRSSYDMFEKRNERDEKERGEGQRDRGGEREREKEERSGKEEEQKRPHTTPNMKKTSISILEKESKERSSLNEEEKKRREEMHFEQHDEENVRLINDLKRKLDTERYRREILEKRNGELMRELRRLNEKK